MSTHLVVCLSSHGFGHIGQTAPLVHELRARLPRLRVTLRSNAPHSKLVERLGGEISIRDSRVDVGWIQHNALDVAVEESAEAYREFHRYWNKRITREAGELLDLRPDLVLANVPYLPLAAATRIGVPSVAYCSINWAEIYQHYFKGRRTEAASILTQMRDAYNCARCFLCPEPAMPLEGIDHLHSIGPVAQLGTRRRAELDQRLRLTPRDTVVLISLGGMDVGLGVESWPRSGSLRFIVPDSWPSRNPDLIPLRALGLPFADVMASCDALVAKPGYGSFVEAACLGIPVLYVERGNWPESPYLVSWLQRNGRCAPIGREPLLAGDIASHLTPLLSATHGRLPEPRGIPEAADTICALLEKH